MTNKYILSPKTKEELIEIIKNEIKLKGRNCDLNHIDVSNITDMSYLFKYSLFCGDISKWDVSNVKNMSYMFYCSIFNGDISKWNISKVEDMNCMFKGSYFKQDISKWKIHSRCEINEMFFNCSIDDKYKPIKKITEMTFNEEEVNEWMEDSINNLQPKGCSIQPPIYDSIPTPKGLFVNQGWECPKCGRVYSPYTYMCHYCGKKEEINEPQPLKITF